MRPKISARTTVMISNVASPATESKLAKYSSSVTIMQNHFGVSLLHNFILYENYMNSLVLQFYINIILHVKFRYKDIFEI